MKSLSVVVFGATGDLFKNKLAKAFFELYRRGVIPETFSLFGISRKSIGDEEFRLQVKEMLTDYPEDEVLPFLSKLFFITGDTNEPAVYENIKSVLFIKDTTDGVCAHKLFYLAVTPDLYENIFINLSKAGLSVPCASSFGKTHGAETKILVEKPFGKNKDHAKKLDLLLCKLFDEDQIFRIDHYLAKETMQSIFSFRFQNALFEQLWSSKYIEKVEIKAYETNDVAKRAHFYDSVGAFRDFGQNHFLEILSLLTLEELKEYKGEVVRVARAKVLSEVVLSEVLVRGQYEGYEGEDKNTETYFKVALKIKNERWKGVRFILEHGKALNENMTEVVVSFKNNEHGKENKVIFRIQPHAEICTSVFVGFEEQGVPKEMCFPLGVSNQAIYPYEKLLTDALHGDQTLFVSSKEVSEEWRITTEVLQAFSVVPLVVYKRGSFPGDITNLI